jgi:DNA polymerase alpha subunit A
MSLSLRTLLNAQHQHEIVALSGLLWTGVSPDASSGTASRCSAVFTVVRDPEGVGFQARFSEALSRGATPGCKLEVARNEKALLSFFLAQLQRHDPDVLVGHNILGFDLGVLLHRMRATGVDGWSRLGRLNWSQWPRARAGSTEASWAERQILSGRLVCDTWVGAKEHVRAKNYSLSTLVTQLMPELAASAANGQEEDESLAVFGDPMRLRHLCQAPESLLRLLRKCEQDAYQQAMLMFRLMLLPLTKQLTCVGGNLWSRTLSGARAERNEFLLLHEFHAAKYICPDRPGKAWAPPPPPDLDDEHGGEDEEAAGQRKATTGSGRRKPAYAGGLVLEPKRGFYDKIVLLLDFNSLYPSIIQEYNICFTTVARDESSVPGLSSFCASSYVE